MPAPFAFGIICVRSPWWHFGDDGGLLKDAREKMVALKDLAIRHSNGSEGSWHR